MGLAVQLRGNVVSPEIEPLVRTKVLLRARWSDPWRLARYWEPVTVSVGASPNIDSARLRYRTGLIKREDQTDFAMEPAVGQDFLTANGQYVKVLAVKDNYRDQHLFTGRVVRTELSSYGETLGPTRDYELIAAGMGVELDRIKVNYTYLTNTGSDQQRIQTTLVFNERFERGVREIGNRSENVLPAASGRASYVFAGRNQTSGRTYVWNAYQIIEYLLERFTPSYWTLWGQTAALDAIEPFRLDPTGRTVWDIISEIIDRRRGLGFAVEGPNDQLPNGQMRLRIFTQVEAPVSLGTYVHESSGQSRSRTLPANLWQSDIDVSQFGHRIGVPRISYDNAQEYEYIEVRGARVVVCFTVSPRDGTLLKGWTDSLEAEYLLGDRTDSRRHDILRQRDRYKHVFAKFLLYYPWNWQAGNGDIARTGGALNGVNPTVGFDGTLNANRPNNSFYRSWGLKLLDVIPFRLESQDDADAYNALAPQYRRPFVIIYDKGKQAWRPIDAAPGIDDVAASVSALENELGLEIRASPNHLLAKEDWPRAGFSVPEEQIGMTSHPPKHDWRDIIATVAMEQDNHAQIVRRIPGSRVTGRILTIDVPDCQLWWVVRGTVIDLDGGQPRRVEDTYRLRDDTDRLRAIAGLAEAWYSRPRATVELPFNCIESSYAVGQLIRNVKLGSAPAANAAPTPSNGVVRSVNAVITRITWDFDEPHTSIEAGYGEVDFAPLAGNRAGGSLR